MTTAPRRRSKPKGVRVVKVATQAATLDALTRTLFNTNLLEFVTGKTAKGYRPGSDGSSVLTLPELLGAGPGGIGGNYSSGLNFSTVVKQNIMDNALEGIGYLIAVRGGVAVLKKMGVFRDLNNVNKMLGINDIARWS